MANFSIYEVGNNKIFKITITASSTRKSFPAIGTSGCLMQKHKLHGLQSEDSYFELLGPIKKKKKGKKQFRDCYTHENSHNCFVLMLGNPKKNRNIKLRIQIYNRNIYCYSSGVTDSRESLLLLKQYFLTKTSPSKQQWSGASQSFQLYFRKWP